ncbi:hypothetical protein HOY80DRAFT_1063236 [Tuber brumale]|nr:hypothetical protein HOY80DRAFT_1063236 [Tuber brumale]
MPAEKVLFIGVALQIEHPEGVGVPGEGRHEDRSKGGSRRLFQTRLLAEVGFEAFAYVRTTILGDYLKDVGKAVQVPPRPGIPVASPNPPSEKEPAAIITRCTNQEQPPMAPSGHSDGTNRKAYCRFSQHFKLPRYLE